MKRILAMIGAVCITIMFETTAYADAPDLPEPGIEVITGDWDDDGEGEEKLNFSLNEETENSVDVLDSNLSSIRVERDGAGMVVISDRNISIPVYALDGTAVKTVELQRGRNSLPELAHGIYVICGKKIRL